jgi:hypothetical protein
MAKKAKTTEATATEATSEATATEATSEATATEATATEATATEATVANVLEIASDIGAKGVKTTDDAKAAAEERSKVIREALEGATSKEDQTVVAFGDAYKIGAAMEWASRPRFDGNGKAYDMPAVIRLLSGKTDKKDAARETKEAVKTCRSVSRMNWKRDVERAFPEWKEATATEATSEATEATSEATEATSEATEAALPTTEEFLTIMRRMVAPMPKAEGLAFLALVTAEARRIGHSVLNGHKVLAA